MECERKRAWYGSVQPPGTSCCKQLWSG